MGTKDKVWHEGVVRNITAKTIEVVINSHSACSGCHAQGACGMADMKQKIVTVDIPSFPLAVGDQVKVYASLQNAFYSVLLAYVLPSLLIIAAIFFLEASGSSELTAALISLFLLAGYFFVLYRFKNAIGKKIRFTVEKIG